MNLDPSAVRTDSTGVLRVGETRVPLDLVVREHLAGRSSLEIAADYDALTLADVDAAIRYFHSHEAEVREYLDRREVEAAELERRVSEYRLPLSKDELLARRNSEIVDAPSGR